MKVNVYANKMKPSVIFLCTALLFFLASECSGVELGKRDSSAKVYVRESAPKSSVSLRATNTVSSFQSEPLVYTGFGSCEGVECGD